MKKKKVFALKYLTESIEDDISYFEKRMFGGLAIYLHGRMVMLFAEDPGNTSWKGVKYDFEIWNGVLLPTFFEHQESLQKDFPNLLQHPILKKWLFLNLADPAFESTAEELLERISKNDERFGIFPKEKSKKKKAKAKKKTTKKVKKKTTMSKAKTKKAVKKKTKKKVEKK